MKDCKVAAYGLRPKAKGRRRTVWIDSQRLFELLIRINNLPYRGRGNATKVRNIHGYDLALFIYSDGEITFAEDDVTRVPFRVGRITDETWSGIDVDGNLDAGVPLEDGKKLCFLTHGAFVFKRIRDTMTCTLLLERRAHCIFLNELLVYLNKFEAGMNYDVDILAKDKDIEEVLREFEKARFIKLRNQEISYSDDGIGTNVVQRKRDAILAADEVTFRLSRARSVLGQLFDFISEMYTLRERHTQENVENYKKEVITEFVENEEIKIYGRLQGHESYRWINLFLDYYLFFLQVEQFDNGLLDSNDFFAKLNTYLTTGKITELTELSRQFYDSV